jgi:hypothetical protein
VKQEREAAQKLSGQVDRLLAGGSTDATEDGFSSIAKELAVARRLRGWSERLPPVPAGLQRRVRRIVEAPPVSRRPRTWRSAAWGALAATLVFLLIWMVAPSGQQVWAGMLQALKLRQTHVELTPTLGAPTRAVREPLRDLLAAELLMGRAPSLPKTLPEGYELIEIVAVSYPDLPAWISQPLFIEFGYGPEGSSPGLRLHQYRLLFREYGGISAFRPASESISEFEIADVSGVPGVLLTFSRGDATYAVVWERDGLLLELETDRLEKAELLEIAQTVR